MIALAMALAVTSAQADARVAISIEPCEQVSIETDAVVRMLSAELSADGVRADASDAAGAMAAVRIALECTNGSVRARVHVDDSVTRKTVARVVDLGDVASRLAPRTLVLAVSDLLRATWAELVLVPEVESESEPEPAIRRAVRRAMVERIEPRVADAVRQEDVPRLGLRIGAGGRLVERYGHGTLRASAGIAIALAEIPLAFTAVAGIEGAIVADALGDISILHPCLDAGASYQAVLRPIVLSAGAFVAGGPVFLDAAANAPAIGEGATGFALAIGVRAGLGLVLGSGFLLRLDLDVAYPIAAVAARSGGVDAAGIDGVLAGLELAIVLPLVR